MPFFIGLSGKTVSMTTGTFSANELPGETVEPASLFEAQLELRLKTNTAYVSPMLNYILEE